MDIAALSMNMSMAKLQQGVSISVAKSAMEVQETQATQVLEMLNDLPAPPSGHQLDVYV